MEKLLIKLQSWIKFIQAAVLGTIVVEAILVIFIGVASNKITDTFTFWAGLLIGCSILYIFLLAVKTIYQLRFPGSIVEELIAKQQLEAKIKLFDRQKAINEYFDFSIRALNSQTCVISTEPAHEHLCDKELEVRVADLLNPLLDYTDVLLDTSTEKKFTIGLHLDNYQKLPTDYSKINILKQEDGSFNFDDWSLISDKGIIVLRDQFNMSTELLPKQLLEIQNNKNAAYEIESAIKRTMRNISFTTHSFTWKNDKYSIICSPVLQVCSDDDVDGAFFIIYKGSQPFPEDVPEILGIFNRILSNYVTKYNTCIADAVLSKKQKDAKTD